MGKQIIINVCISIVYFLSNYKFQHVGLWLVFKKKFIMDFPCAQTVKNLHVIHETQVQSLAQEDPLEK